MSALPAELPPATRWQRLKIDQHRVHQQVEAWAKELGPVFRMKLGRRELVVISDHEAIRAVLRDRPAGFRRKPFRRAACLLRGCG